MSAVREWAASQDSKVLEVSFLPITLLSFDGLTVPHCFLGNLPSC